MNRRAESGPWHSFLARYEALFRVSRAICVYRDPKDLFRVLANELRHVVDFNFIAVFLYDEAANKLHNPVVESIKEPRFKIPEEFPVEETITWWVYQHQEPVVIRDSTTETRFRQMMAVYQQFGVRSGCTLPLTTAHRRLGSLGFGLEESHGYSEDEVRYLSMVADQVALAVDNALRNQEREGVEEELRNQTAHFEKLFDLAPEAIVLRDLENRILRTNRKFTELFGFSLEESVGRNVSDLIVPDELWEESEAFRDALKQGRRVDAEIIRQRKDGTRLHVSFVAAPVPAQGGATEIFGIYRDITRRKRAEEALIRNEAYLSEAQRLSHTGSWARSVATGDFYLSRESFRIFGLDPVRTKPTLETILTRIHRDDRRSVEETIRTAIDGRSDFERDYRIVLDDGTIRHIHVLGHPVIDASGNLVEFVGTHMDITEQVHSRAALESALNEIRTLKDQLYQENIALRQEIDETSMFEEIVGRSNELRQILRQVETVAPTDSTVLINGETGTGKELIARAIHNLSSRRANAFVKLNCASIPTGLLESELFGHEKGAFTGAIAQRIGRFELANRGTVFLDEIGEIPLELQPKLLRVLQEREFERLGSSRTLRTDARLIAATNRDLTKMVEEQTFRSDLFYRLNVIPIRVPALRERPEDVPLLVQHFAEQFSRRMRKAIKTIPSETMNAMIRYEWPGNVRELQNVIERAVILSADGVLRVPAADLRIRAVPHAKTVGKAPAGARRNNTPLPDREQIVRALQETSGRVGGPDGAAARLGLKRTTLIAQLKRLGINPRTVIRHF